MLVFVYGSLKRGFPLSGALVTSRYVGTVPLQGYTLHSAGAFPYMIPCHNGIVLGELYDVDKRTLDRLDRVEKEGNLYTRESIGEYEGQEVYSYLAKSIQNPGFADWKDQPAKEDTSEELRYLACDLLDDGISYSSWEQLRRLIDTDEFDDYIDERDNMVFLKEEYWSA